MFAKLGPEADNGILGVAVLIILISLLSVAFTGVFYLAAIKSEDPQTPFMMQPIGLTLAFLSSALVPIAIMPGWSRAVARSNPVSVVVDASRHAMIGDLWRGTCRSPQGTLSRSSIRAFNAMAAMPIVVTWPIATT